MRLSLLRFSAVYEKVGFIDSHSPLLVPSKHWPQLSISNSLSNYLLKHKTLHAVWFRLYFSYMIMGSRGIHQESNTFGV